MYVPTSELAVTGGTPPILLGGVDLGVKQISPEQWLLRKTMRDRGIKREEAQNWVG